MFNDIVGKSPEDLLLGELETIDLHHGTYSSDPPYTLLEVRGVALSGPIKAALVLSGFNEFRPAADGFSASRQLPPPSGL